MKLITEQIIKKINEDFLAKYGYKGSWNNSEVYCPQVNGLVNLCLNSIGHKEEARKNIICFLRSPSFCSDEGLFYRETDLNGNVVVPAFNTCKNAVMALSLGVNEFKEEARRIIENVENSPLNGKGLFYREYHSMVSNVQDFVVTQSNLWMGLAYCNLGDLSKARTLMRKLEVLRFDSKNRLFNSQDCNNSDSPKKFFVDDQALATLLYIKINEINKANSLINSILNSPFFDPKSNLFNSSFFDSTVDVSKSTYKNSLMALALKEMNHLDELKKLQKSLAEKLFDKEAYLFNQTIKNKTKVPDNSTLALFTIRFDKYSKPIF